jgi:hypothetical protein
LEKATVWLFQAFTKAAGITEPRNITVQEAKPFSKG